MIFDAMKYPILGISLIVAGCQLIPPYHITVKYFIVFDNKLDTPVTITTKGQHVDNKPYSIPSMTRDYTYDYEAKSKSSPFPERFESIQFNIENYQFELDRSELERVFERNPEGYPRWDLVIDEDFVTEFGC